MIPRFFVKIFGPNWRTGLTGIGSALTGLLTLLAAVPYELGSVAEIIPPEAKAKVFMVGAVSTFLLRVINGWNAKDKQVTGNNPDNVSTGDIATKVATE